MEIKLLVVLLFGTCLARTTIDPTFFPNDCDGHHSHPTNPNMFRVLVHGVFIERPCAGRLIWDQELCACTSPPCAGDNDPTCFLHRPDATDTKNFEICDHGEWKVRDCPISHIWNQTSCRCDWDPLIEPGGVVVGGPVTDAPCGSIFHASFDESIKDDGPFGFIIGRLPWNVISIDNAVDGAVGGGAAKAENGGMPLWFTSGNDMGDIFQFFLRFRVRDDGRRDLGLVNVLSNVCDSDKTTISIFYDILDQSYTVFFRNETTPGTTKICPPSSFSRFGWHELSFEYRDDRTVFKVDGSPCFTSTELTGKLGFSHCPIILGGRLPGDSQKFNGFFDEVIFRKGCIIEV